MREIQRTRSKLIYTNKEYKFLVGIYCDDPYWNEGITYYPKYRFGFKNPNKRIMSYQIRMYKTWKHNRKTQYKQ